MHNKPICCGNLFISLTTNISPQMHPDQQDHASGNEGFTEIQVEIPDELYHKAVAAAQAVGITLDEWVAEMIHKEVKRRAMDSGEEVEK